MSDTSKATPRPWEIRVADPAMDEIEDMSLYLIETPLVGKTIGGIIDEQEANAVLLKESANSYNPERDKLARSWLNLSYKTKKLGAWRFLGGY